jgi:hypothetical protein
MSTLTRASRLLRKERKSRVADEFIRIIESGCLRHKTDNNRESGAEELRILQRDIKDLTAMVMKLNHGNTLAGPGRPRRRRHPSPASAR